MDSYPSLKGAAFFYVSNSCQSPQIQNADFPCRIQHGAKPSGWEGSSNMLSPGQVQSNPGAQVMAAPWVCTGLRAGASWRSDPHQSVLVAARCFFQAGCPYCGRLSEECHWAQQCPSLDSLLSPAAFDGGLSWQPSGQIKHGAGGWGVRQASRSPMKHQGSSLGRVPT